MLKLAESEACAWYGNRAREQCLRVNFLFLPWLCAQKSSIRLGISCLRLDIWGRRKKQFGCHTQFNIGIYYYVVKCLFGFSDLGNSSMSKNLCHKVHWLIFSRAFSHIFWPRVNEGPSRVMTSCTEVHNERLFQRLVRQECLFLINPVN